MISQPLIAERSPRQVLHQPAGRSGHDGGLAAAASGALPDDLEREVYCVLGIPVDAIDMPEALRRVKAAAAAGVPYLLSTPNLNFLTSAQSNAEFRESLLQSDLCPADGVPIVWIARMLGLPIQKKVAGSDIFAMLREECDSTRPLKVFLFGGGEGIAAAAGDAINSGSGGLTCVGTFFPGYGTFDQMSTDEAIDAINASGADFLAVALSAGKGQRWLRHNHGRLRVPVRAQLGAVINFQAGTIRRAPSAVRKLGLEWLWRIKEEPYLWRRYADDAVALVRLLSQIVPLAVAARWKRLAAGPHDRELLIQCSQFRDTLVLNLTGAGIAANVDKAIVGFRDASAAGQNVTIDLSGLRDVDARFLGLILMLRKKVMAQGHSFGFTGVTRSTEKMLTRNGLGFLLGRPVQKAPRANEPSLMSQG